MDKQEDTVVTSVDLEDLTPEQEEEILTAYTNFCDTYLNVSLSEYIETVNKELHRFNELLAGFISITSYFKQMEVGIIALLSNTKPITEGRKEEIAEDMKSLLSQRQAYFEQHREIKAQLEVIHMRKQLLYLIKNGVLIVSNTITEFNENQRMELQKLGLSGEASAKQNLTQ